LGTRQFVLTVTMIRWLRVHDGPDLSQMEPGGGLAQGSGALFDGGVGPNPYDVPQAPDCRGTYLAASRELVITSA